MIITRITKFILNAKPFYRKITLFIADIFLLHLSFHASSLYFDYGLILNFQRYLVYLLLTSFIAPILYKFTGQYKSLARYVSNYSIYRMIIRNTFLITISIYLCFFLNINFPPIKEQIFIWLLVNTFSILLRIILCDILGKIISKKKSNVIKSVVIYGADQNGFQLMNILKNHSEYKLKFFLDDNPSFNGRFINKYPIYNSKFVKNLKDNIDLILLPSNSSNNKLLNSTLNEIKSNNIPVLKMPSIEEIANGHVRIDSIKPILIEEFLGREPVLPNKNLLSNSIEEFNICIIGAGGSIGSELSRQILKLNPSEIILIERNEPSLYKLNYELSKLNDGNISVKSILGSARNYKLIHKIFVEHKIDIVFHAAAYKHVPLVEKNPIQGISNNVLSTYEICKACHNSNVKKMILISTDKAVRPTNVMGASKRLSELIVQANAEITYKKENFNMDNQPIFSIVRFGNVLNSSGSVLPLFRKQIESGGPITLTHELVERYFMTIPEAAQLVLQASSLSLGGEIFLLDMGESKKIKELAEKMIFSYGFTVKSKENPNGDIEIKTIGLRPGEKLYEELLIDGLSEKTKHPLIYKAKENTIKAKKLFEQIKILKVALENMDEDYAFSIISNLIPEWNISNYK